MDKETISQWSEGIVASTGCPSGGLQTRLRLGQYDEALKAAADYQDIFGKDRYFLELMDHGIEIEHRVRDGLLEIGKKLGIPPLVTNDSHYTYAHEATAHDALLCIQTGKNLSDPDRFKFDGTGYYLKSTEEMYAVDSSDAWQEGCANTLLVAEMVDTTGMFEAKNLMPKFDIPDGYTEVTWFKEEVRRGMERRFPGGIPEDRQKQADYEMDVIIQMGFPGYFLVVADFIMWAKNNGIAVGPGRGSAAGSIVAYAMGITDLDPIPHGLIFERFLNPERVSMPDVDIDFDERRRVEVIRYVTEKYGADKVAMIGTYGKIKAKNAIKDSARVLGYPYAMGDRLTKAMPADVLGKGIDLDGITNPSHPRYNEAGEIRGMYENEPDVKKVIDTAKGVEGLVRQMGVHAAGVIMTDAIVDHAPIWVRHTDGVTITQWDYPQCESLGLLKMDFLGLRNLTIMDDAIKMVKANKGIDLEMLALPLDDPKTFELLCRGDTLGVFQFDGGPMRSLLRQMQPDNFEEHLRRLGLDRPADGHQLAHQLRGAQERPPGDHPDPQGAGGAARGGPRGHLRPDRLPGAGPEGRPDHRRVLARRGRHPAPRDGQRRSPTNSRRTSPSSRPAPRRTATATRPSRPCGTSWSPSPATPSTRPTPPRTDWSPTGPPTSRPTTRPSTWPRCSPRSRTTRTSRPSTSTSAGA
ncbi:Error-prone DNA polymerase [Streptomyces griseorubiginosus]